MDRRTVDIYEARARAWITARAPRAIEDGRLPAFVRRVAPGGRVADLGCGPGWYVQAFAAAGLRPIALDVSAAMLSETVSRAPGVPGVRADLAALPFAARALDGAWAVNSYCHVPAAELPLALAYLHHALRLAAAVELTLPDLDAFRPSAQERKRGECERRSERPAFPGRLFVGVSRKRARALLIGAGFDQIRIETMPDAFWLRLTARRARTLPDLVRPGLRLLVCGLNPSLYSADAGIPFARPGNRFWAAARLAGVIVHERDPWLALAQGVGMTDLVKRATAGAAELGPHEYERGFARLAELVRRHRPAAICFVGLDGWRRAIDRQARPGWAPRGFASQPAYLMPSTSGRNARVSLPALAAHLATAARARAV